MKYFFTTAIKLLAFSLFLLLFNFSLQAQKTTHSPYSRYGIGLINPKNANANMAMGGLGYAWRPQNYKPQIYDSLARSNAKLNDRGTNFINLKNPASYSNFSLTTFEAGIFAQGEQLRSAQQSSTESTAYLSHVMLAMPIAQKWGLAFGLRPFSKLGYDYANQDTLAGGQGVSNLYSGSGGLNQLLLGTAYELSKNLSVGINASYIFGRLEDESRVVYENGSFFFNTLDQNQLRVNDFTFDFGLQYFASLNQDYRLVAGLNVSPVSDLQAERFQLIRNYAGEQDFENFKDTIVNLEAIETEIAIANSLGGGLSLEKKGEWLVGLDYILFQREQEEVEPGIVLDSYSEINLGFERFNKLSSFGSFFKQMGYRAGLRYNTGFIAINGEAVEEFGIGFGIVMPLRKSFSTLNLGLEVGRRGKDEGALVEENFLNFQLGITINDKWFIQRKYD